MTIDGVPPSMPAAVYRGVGELGVEELPVRAPGPGEVLIEVSHCGVCGSDLHFVIEGWGRPGTVPGHETSGTIVAVGDGVTGWEVGDAVAIGPEETCGECEMCTSGHSGLCDGRVTPGTTDHQGAFAGYQLVDAAQLLRIPDGLSRRVAALAEPLAVALHGITQSGIRPGQRALVFGAGPIGALVTATLAARGFDVAVVEPAPRRRELATAVGAARVVEPADLEVPSIAEPGRIVDGAVDVVYECSGKRAAMEAGLAQLKRRGTLVIVGAGIEPPRFDPNRILLNELVVTGSYCYDDDGFEDALTLLASGDLPTDVLIDPVDVPLDGALDAMQRLAAGEIAGKVMIVPRRRG